MNIQKLRELPIEQVAQNLGMKVQKHKTLCPFHSDKHPSLSFKVSKNTFKCFACGAHGSTITLAMQVLGKDFKETCHWLANEHNIITCHPERSEGSENTKSEITQNSELITQKYSKFFEHPYLNMAAKRFLYTERKIHPGVVRWCRLTSWTDRYGTPWLQIPYFDTDGTLIGVQNRRLTPYHPERSEGSQKHQDGKPYSITHNPYSLTPNPYPITHNPYSITHNPYSITPNPEKEPRFLFPSGSQCQIYNLPILNLLKEGENLWITEGCSDCWAMLSSGRKAIAIPSATLLKPKDLDVLRTHNSKLITLHMSPDNDEPGERLYLQLKKLFPQLVRHPLPHGIKDFAEYWAMSNER